MVERHISVEFGTYIPAPKRDVEIVERKGVGHPDSLIDGMVEEVSRALSRYYLEEFGCILHHNVDKGQVCAGETNVEFGGGVVIKPIYILLSGRATEKVDNIHVPVQHIVLKTARDYLRTHLPNLDAENDVILDSKICGGSPDLVDLFRRKQGVPLANDTSFGTGYAPMSTLERIVYSVENYLNSKEYKDKHPAVGEDIKVMGMRDGQKFVITVAIAFISKYLHSVEEYVAEKEQVEKDVYRLISKITDKEIEVRINTGDDIQNQSVYITLTGTSAEMGDDGSVGRGNRVNGLITPMRSMTLEAAAGKNPVNHVGKIYSFLAFDIANTVVEEYPDIEDITITLLSQIGKPIDQPKVASAQMICSKEIYEKLKDKVRYVVDGKLERITEITQRIVADEETLKKNHWAKLSVF